METHGRSIMQIIRTALRKLTRKGYQLYGWGATERWKRENAELFL